MQSLSLLQRIPVTSVDNQYFSSGYPCILFYVRSLVSVCFIADYVFNRLRDALEVHSMKLRHHNFVILADNSLQFKVQEEVVTAFARRGEQNTIPSEGAFLQGST